MFKMPDTIFNAATNYFSVLPKNAAEVRETLTKVESVLRTEALKSKEVWETNYKAARGEASVNEIVAANLKTTELLLTAQFACLAMIPGSLFFLPVLVGAAKEFGVNIVPESIRKEFNL